MSVFNREEYLAEVNSYIPWGSSTCSKAPSVPPYDPAAIERGKGCRVWDIEGREFIDFRNGLGPVTLGYAYDEVNKAIIEQLEKGIVYGNPSVLEPVLAKKLCEIIPCAEMVRFLKTGGEAVAACMRLARGYTGRDHIIQIGYNGWLNSLSATGAVLPGRLGTSTKSGVPKPLADLHHSASFGNMAAVEKIVEDVGGNVAAIVVASAYNNVEVGKTFYPALRKLCDEKGIVLVYDEIVTGFRVALGGVQEYFGVTPDLAVFSKGMANGMPISAFCGKRDVMKCCDRGGGVIISSTFGGDAVSIASALATINIYQRDNVVDYLWKTGTKLWGGINALFEEYGIPAYVDGYMPCATFLSKNGSSSVVSDVMREAYKNGISFYSVSYINYSHKEKDVEEVLAKMKTVCETLSEKYRA